MQIFGALSFCSPVLSRRHSAFSAAAAKLQWADGEYSGPQDDGGKYIAPPPPLSPLWMRGKSVYNPFFSFFRKKPPHSQRGPTKEEEKGKTEIGIYVRLQQPERRIGGPSPPSPPIKSFKKHLPPPLPQVLWVCKIAGSCGAG